MWLAADAPGVNGWRGNSAPPFLCPSTTRFSSCRDRHQIIATTPSCAPAANTLNSHPDVVKFKPQALKLSKAYVPQNWAQIYNKGSATDLAYLAEFGIGDLIGVRLSLLSHIG